MALAAAFKNRQRSESRGQRAEPGLRNRSGLRLIRQSSRAVAIEAKYAGINTILAPGARYQHEPQESYHCGKGICEDPATVSLLGVEWSKPSRATALQPAASISPAMVTPRSIPMSGFRSASEDEEAEKI